MHVHGSLPNEEWQICLNDNIASFPLKKGQAGNWMWPFSKGGIRLFSRVWRVRCWCDGDMKRA